MAIKSTSSMASQCGVSLPNSTLVREATEFIRDTESELLFNHSSRVYCFAALAGERKALSFDPELLYVGAMFHDMGLTEQCRSAESRFEVDGANAAAEFLRQRGLAESEIYEVWTAIALHTTPEVPHHMSAVVALVTAGVEMDVLGLTYLDYSDEVRLSVVTAFPRTATFKEDIINAFYDGIRQKPQTTFGNVKADVLVDKDPLFKPINFCDVIRTSRWSD